MSILPSMPPQEGLHPLIVHFPIALLLTAPLLVVLGLLWRAHARVVFAVAALLIVLGAAAAALAVGTGEAAEHAAEMVPAASRTLERHEELAELTRNLFLALAAAGVALAAAAWKFLDRARGAAVWGIGLVFLAGYAGASLVLVNAAHEGGRLVHEFGVRAPGAGRVVSTAERADARDGERDD